MGSAWTGRTGGLGVGRALTGACIECARAAGYVQLDAISAGREVRVIVEPKQIDDLTALKLARDIADKIEATMSYPGIIKVNVIRETRAIEYAK